MDSFNNYNFCGNKSIFDAILSSLKNGMLPHAILLLGPQNIGKTTLAKIMAKSLLCKDYPNCEDCKDCQKIELNEHADLWFKDNDEVWKLEEIHNLQNFLNLSSLQGLPKIAIIPSASNMTEEAANALLKILEEPPINRFLILTAEKKENLLPTIASRLHYYELLPSDEEEMKLWLAKKFSADNLDLDELIKYSHNRPGLASLFTQNNDLLEASKDLAENFSSLKSSPLHKIFQFSEKFSKKSENEQAFYRQELIYNAKSLHLNLGSVEKLLKYQIYKKSYAQDRLLWDNLLWELSN